MGCQNRRMLPVTLTTPQIPIHNHAVIVSQDLANQVQPTNQILGQSTQILMFTQDTAAQFMPAPTLSVTGGSQLHDNMQPFLVVTFIISLFGIYPTQN